MSRLFTVREIVDRALRKIGAYSIRDQGADGEEVTESLFWLDMIVAKRFGEQRTLMAVPATIAMPLTTGVDTYVLDSVLGTAAGGGVEFVTNLRLMMDNGNGQPCDAPIEMVSRDVWEARSRPGPGDRPCMALVDRNVPVTLRLFPAPQFVAPAAWSLEIVTQQIPMDFTLEDEERATRMRSCFNLWAVIELAGQIGDGPIRRLPRDETDSWKREAEDLWADLIALDMQENTSAPNATAYNDF